MGQISMEISPPNGSLLSGNQQANIAKCSQDTALRDIDDLLGKKILAKEAAGGRSTSYVLAGTAA
ncbi:hypothetical protein DevBK_11825 [Devosia sp. BK]|uniref:hypothetical protein n=1 Tax=Devosia sp. BK TaxID=2871706 RepID=UPI00293A7E6B|nr:hypothetical protein [Devosia sp. BK]MDV3252022.1 hypothetical protein [Devosia sp. BK]